MAAVMISIHPKWCGLIASGQKTIEVRKTRPKMCTPFKCYIYCTKDPKLHFWHGKRYSYVDDHSHNLFDRDWNGMVIGEFVCDEIIKHDIDVDADCLWGEEQDCLTDDEFEAYIENVNVIYGWHISDLVIYEQPKELNEFFKYEKDTTIEVLTDDETLCSYCAAYDYGNTKHWSSPISGGGFCEGSACKDAYRSYLKENFAIARPPQSWMYVEELA